LPKAASDRKDIFEAIQEEMGAIGKTEEDRIAMFASDSDAESVSSFLSNEKKTLEETGDLVKRNERLFGNVSLSFFPIPW
jgi:vacuolar-type H+-ATPase subunit E/Vma4